MVNATHIQCRQKLNVFACTMIGSYFIEGNLNAEHYAQLLRNQIVPTTQTVKRDDIENTWVQ